MMRIVGNDSDSSSNCNYSNNFGKDACGENAGDTGGDHVMMMVIMVG